MKYSFIAYVFLSIIIILGGVYTLHSRQRPYSAVMCLIFFTSVMVFFGQRWFKDGISKGNYTGTWPPLINMCPDYLVYYKRNGAQDTCIDISGVNRSGGSLKAWTTEETPKNPPSDPSKYFNFVYKSGADVQALCQAAMNAGLTWEGITNGDSCTYSYSGADVAAARGGAACPSPGGATSMMSASSQPPSPPGGGRP
jgi:hypothetical protein